MKSNHNILNEILSTLPDGNIEQVCVGLHWTAVTLTVAGELRCGLASTLHHDHQHGVADVPAAGKLQTYSGLELAALSQSEQPTLVSIGMAAVNALLPRQPEKWDDINAEEVIAEYGIEKPVALIGHFPFVERLRERVGQLTVLELNPRPDDLPASAAPAVLPDAAVVAITSMTLLNHTLDGLLALCSPQAQVILIGPSTPLSPVLFDYGVNLLCGSIVTNIRPVFQAVQQGANFRQVHKMGVRLITLQN